jgi:hypothetical protein
LSRKYLFPYELIELNWRFYSFLALLAAGGLAALTFPVAELNGYIDPLYSPTVLIVPLPTLFRLSCYAYRKDYYRHLFDHPLGCKNSQRDERHTEPYTGERNIIFQFWNFHRYFLYVGLALLPFFYYDFYHSLTYSGVLELRLGSLIILANALCLTAWTLSCHAFRHIIGGNIDCYSCVYGGGARRKAWSLQSWWNAHHEQMAWLSLLVFVLTDLYLRGLSAGLPLDYKFF